MVSRIPPPASFAREIEVARDLARAAGVVVMEHYAGRFEVEYKDAADTDPVTAADKDANQIIVDGLRAAFPDDAILAEESTDDHSRLGQSRLWCVDPLDGTREFVDRNGQFVIMIGLSVAGAARAGVVFQPTEDLLWWGADGVAVEVRPGGEEVPLRVAPVDEPADATLMVSRSHRSKTVTAVAERLGVEREEPLGSVGLKISRIVTGAAHLYISTTDRTKEWDACAPEAVITAAGGRMTDLRGRPLGYNKPSPNTPFGMLASNGLLHERAVAALEPVVADRGWA